MIENALLVDRILRTALEEDLGAGDLTTDLTVEPGRKGNATVLSREGLVLAGIMVFSRVFELLYADIRFVYSYKEGDAIRATGQICRVSGPARAILAGERTALNFLQRMCGIATMTRACVEKCAGLPARIVDTRKTAPGLRIFDKYAVRMGGGYNHRFGLHDGILIKDNHIAVCGSITEAVTRARRGAPHTLKVEVEVEDLAGLREAIHAGADAVLLDDMAPRMLRKAVQIARGRVLLEASGGVHIGNVREVAETGVDLISVGGLTHSVKAADISLELSVSGRR
jgi:nicotinate-nucleotide pyrophosphorylase (carboxylating)